MDPRRLAFVLATSAYVLGVAAQTTFVFFLTPAYARANGVPDAEMLAFVVNALAAMVVGAAAGRLADRVPRRRVMRLGWALEAAGALALALMPGGVSALVAAAALVGFGLSYGFVGFQSYLADLVRDRGLARAYGTTGALSVLGGAIGPFLAGRVLASSGIAEAALLVAALAVAGFLLTLPLHSVRGVERPPPAPARVGFAAAALYAFDPREDFRAGAPAGVAPYLAAFAVLGFGFGMTVPWMGPHMLDAHALAPGALGTLVAAATLAGAAGILLAGRAAEKAADPMRVTLVLAIGVALALLAFAFAASLAAAAAFFVVRHFIGNPTGPILNAGLVRSAPESERGRALGFANIAWNLPWAVGALVGGVVRGVSAEALFALGALVILLAPALGLAVRNRRERGASRAGASA